MKHTVFQIKKIAESRIGQYLLFSLSVFFSFELFYIIINIPVKGKLFVHVTRFADALFFSIPVLIYNKKWFAITIHTLINIFLISNILYIRNFLAPIPLTSFQLTNQLPDIKESVAVSFRWFDIAIFLPSLILFLFFHRTIISSLNCWKYLLGCFLSLTFISIIFASPYTFRKKELWRLEHYRMRIPISELAEFGFLRFYADQTMYVKGCSQQEISMAIDYLKHQGSNNTISHTCHNKKNLILITIESLSSWTIGTSLNGEEITPGLNKLISDTTTISNLCVIPQVRDGKSSDAQIVINTGIYPLRHGCAATLFGTNEYPSLPKALKSIGYKTVEYVCDDDAFWNQKTTSHNYGYDRLCDHYGDNDDWAYSDDKLFLNVFQDIRNTENPFLAQIVTISTHEGCKTDYPSRLYGGHENQELINYIVALQHTDAKLMDFIDSLKKAHIYEKSIIVITGDHNSPINKNTFEKRPKCEIRDSYIPFIIINSPIKPKYTGILSQIDIYPSILDLLGVGDYYWRGFGESIFQNHSGTIVTYDGKVYGNKTNYELAKHKDSAFIVSDVIIRSNLFSDDSKITWDTIVRQS